MVREFQRKIRATEFETTLQAQKYELEGQQKHTEFQNMLERAKLEKQNTVELKQLEASMSEVVPTPTARNTFQVYQHYNQRIHSPCSWADLVTVSLRDFGTS